MNYMSSRKTVINQSFAETRQFSIPEGMKKMEIYDLVFYLSEQKKMHISASALRQYYSYIKLTRPIDWQKGNLCMNYKRVNDLAKELGISRRQVCYNNQLLAKQGLIAFVNFGNYRRFGKRDEKGCLIEDRSYGIDLKPVLGLLKNLQKLKEKVAWEHEQHAILRNRVSHLRRKIFNLIPDGLKEDYKEWLSIRPKYDWAIEKLSVLKNQLEKLWNRIVEWYQEQERIAEKQLIDEEDVKNNQEGTENIESVEENFPHARNKFPPLIDNHNTKPYLVKEPSGIMPLDTPHAILFTPHERQDRITSVKMPLSLGQILKLHDEELEIRQQQGLDVDVTEERCENLANIWQNASVLAVNLGIHKTAVAEAVRVFGYKGTSILMNYIESRVCDLAGGGGKAIKNPGGYFGYYLKEPKHAHQIIYKYKETPA